MPLEKLSFLHTLFLENEECPSQKKIQSNVSQVQRSLHAKIQLFLNTFKMAKKSRGHFARGLSIIVCLSGFN